MRANIDRDLRRWLYASGIPVSPFAEGKQRLNSDPCIVPARRMKGLRDAAGAVWSLYEELCAILARRDGGLEDFFGLTPLQRALWYASGGQWHGIVRADLFCTKDGGIAVAELNSDTPSGLDEAYLLGNFAVSRESGLIDPNSTLPEAFVRVIADALGGLRVHPPNPSVGIVYPTDIPEDMGLIAMYRHWLEQRGFRVILGSPANLAKGASGGAELFGEPTDVLLRHYKTDWWCERRPVWKDQREMPDSAPLMRELRIILELMIEGRVAVVNPFGAVVTQNKLSLAFFHERLALFSEDAQRDIRRYIPFTRLLSRCDRGLLAREKDDWVLKSGYGCEGEEVIIGRDTETKAWERALDLAVPDRWIVQRYFDAEQDEAGLTENYGVYLAGGKPCGMYMRLSRGATTGISAVAPVLERPPLAEALAARFHPPAELPRPDGCVAELLRAYTPGESWLPFRKGLIFHSAADQGMNPPLTPDPRSCAAFQAGALLARMVGSADESTRGSVMVVSDLDGPESVAFGAGLSEGADIVVQVENIASPHETVPLRETLGAFVHYAALVRAHHERRAGAVRPPAVFVLDRRRMTPVSHPARELNNRHWAYLPEIAGLRERGIDTLLYVHPAGEDSELDDLNEDFRQYHDAGIRLCFSSPIEIGLDCPAGLAGHLERTVRTPARRETIFSSFQRATEEQSQPGSRISAENQRC